MILPPRAAERVLESLGAEPDFREAVLGDLAEEFALRAERDGMSAARRWYYREAVRATPHLLYNWARRQRVRDVAHLAGVVLTSYVLLFTLTFFVQIPLSLALPGVLAALDLSPVVTSLPWNSPLGLVFVALGVATIAAAGGYVAASLGIRAPIVSAVALGVVWSCADIVMLAVAGAAPPGGYVVGALLGVVVVIGTTLGGIRCVTNSRPPQDALTGRSERS